MKIKEWYENIKEYFNYVIRDAKRMVDEDNWRNIPITRDVIIHAIKIILSDVWDFFINEIWERILFALVFTGYMIVVLIGVAVSLVLSVLVLYIFISFVEWGISGFTNAVIMFLIFFFIIGFLLSFDDRMIW